MFKTITKWGAMMLLLMGMQGVYAQNYVPLTVLGTTNVSGSTASQFNNPSRVHIASDGKVYVSDVSNHRISVWTFNGTNYGNFAILGVGQGSGLNEFNSPIGVHVTSNGRIYIADATNHRISVWTTNGSAFGNLTTFGGNGFGANQFNFPFGVTLDVEGRILVTERNNNRVSVWTTSGNTFGNLTTFGTSGSTSNQFFTPDGIRVHNNGYIYVVDRGNNRICVWTASGNTFGNLTTFGGSGIFNNPTDISLTNDGKILIVNPTSHRVDIYSTLPGDNYGLVSTFGGLGTGASQLRFPSGISQASDGKVYIADVSNHRINIFKPCNAPTIVTQPTNATVCSGASTTFGVTVSGATTGFQWQVNQGAGFTNLANGGVYSNVTTSTLGITGGTNALNGFTYRCIVANNACGATSTGATFNIETTPPTVITQNRTITLSGLGTATVSAAQINNGSSDACGVASLSLSQTSFTCAHIGSNTVTLTVTDVNGNSASGTATVTVVDLIAPAVVTQNRTITLSGIGTATVSAAQINNGSSDACGVASLSLSQTSFTCAHVGPNTVSLTVTDVNGNSASGTATVFVVDETAPAVVTQNRTITINAGGTGTVSAAQINNGTSDACGVASLSLSKTSFTCADIGMNTVTLTAGDVNGNLGRATATVTVQAPSVVIATQPTSQSAVCGSPGTFSVSATGTNLTYLWNNGETTSSITTTIAGIYQATVTGVCGLTQVFNAANLSINGVTTKVTEPVSQSVCSGTFATFSVSATGVGLAYLWNTGVTTESISTSTSGTYMATVSGTCGTQTFNAANLSVNGLTSIISQPVSQSVCSGSLASVSVSATGASLSYLWSNGITTASMQTSLTGNYNVTVSGTCGSAVSNTINITTTPATSFVTQPQNVLFTCLGQNATLTSSATGTGTISYVWNTGTIGNTLSTTIGTNYRVTATGLCGSVVSNGANINQYMDVFDAFGQSPNQTICGGNTGSFSVIPAGSVQYIQWSSGEIAFSIVKSVASIYQATVVGYCNNFVYPERTLTVNPITTIVSPLASATVCSGIFNSFEVSATGANLSYTWSNGASTTNTMSTSSSGTNYNVTVTGTCGSVVSNTVSLVRLSNTAISMQTSSATVCGGNIRSFGVSPAGVNLTYLWNNGVTTNSFSTSVAGVYQATVTGNCGTAVSNQMQLTVNQLTSITGQSTIETVCGTGMTAAFVNAIGTNLTYLWNDPGNYNDVDPDLAAGIYTVTVSGLCGSAISEPVTVTSIATTTIATQPISATVCGGEFMDFGVSATGLNLAYLWNNGRQTRDWFTSVAGSYMVTVSGTCGNAVSNTVDLVNYAPTAVSSLTSNITVLPGVSADLNVLATGEQLSYAWSNGATTSGISGAAAGTYSVTVNGFCGTLTRTVIVTEMPRASVTGFTSLNDPTTGTAPFIVTINGADFVNGATVSINGVALTGVTVVNGNVITATLPSNVTAPYNVQVSNPNQVSNLPASIPFSIAQQPQMQPYLEF